MEVRMVPSASREAKFTGMHSDHCCPILFRPLSTMKRHLDLIDDQTACVIVEPIQGEAGVIVPVDRIPREAQEKVQRDRHTSHIR